MNATNHKLVLAKANLRDAQVKAAHAAARSQNQQVSFWIITMLLVLFGLSTLKLR
jgi:UDP-N-acetylmuramyl pentapeptide phosphotransferase/UDP-N-acetylglucosamine-1-phosphate transferase